MSLSPAHLDLIRTLAEVAVSEGYLTAEPANDAGSSQECAERVPLPATDRAA